MRHGEAIGVAENIRQPLSETGREQVNLIANFLLANNVSISYIFHSEKLRAQQTAEELAKKLSPEKIAILAGLLPDDDVGILAQSCQAWDQDTLLVGHLPFMNYLASLLLTNQKSNLCCNFDNAAIICLEKIGQFQWCLSWFITPHYLS